MSITPYKPTYIAPINQGLTENPEAFLIAQDAFPILENAVVWRDRIRRREGIELLGRLERQLSAVAAGNYSTINGTNTFAIFTALGLGVTEPNAEVKPGTAAFPFVITFAAPIGQTLTGTTNSEILTVGGAGPITSATINYATGVISITGSAAAGPAAVTITTMSYFPRLPVMGLWQRELTTINQEQTIAFDTIYGYLFSNTNSRFEQLGTATWNGSDSQFFWAYNYWISGTQNLLWVTNFSGPTGTVTRYTNGTTFTNFTPLITAADTVFQCLAILPFKDRLLFFNTYEGTTVGGLAGSTNFPQRLRFSQNGDPLNVNAWREDIPGRGGYIDAPTDEIIIGVEFLRDILIVYFERSTWQVRYTGNEILPFVFERIDAELGSESTFSSVVLEDGIVAVGQRSINKTNGNQVGRIDEAIVNQVFQINNDNNGVYRVHGIRDYYNELIYWCYPNAAENPTYPNKVLVYNYRNYSFGRFNDNFTCFGYHQPFNDVRWQDLSNISWQEYNKRWNSGEFQSQFPFVIGGNQQGYVHKLMQGTYNEASLSIQSFTANTLVSPSHGLYSGDFVELTNITGPNSTLNNIIFLVQKIDNDTISLIDVNGDLQTFSTTYYGQGQLIRVENIDIRSKQFSYLEAGYQIMFGYIDFHVANTSTGNEVSPGGEFSINIYADADTSTPINTGDAFCNTSVETYRDFSQLLNAPRIWKRYYANVDGQFLQFQITFSKEEMFDKNINASRLDIYALIIWHMNGGRLI